MTEEQRANLTSFHLYGLIEQAIRQKEQQPPNTASSGAGVASADDALTAVAQLATTIEIPVEASDVDPEEARRLTSLLLVIRDFIAPVQGSADEAVSRYLAEFIDTKLRK